MQLHCKKVGPHGSVNPCERWIAAKQGFLSIVEDWLDDFLTGGSFCLHTLRSVSIMKQRRQ